MILDTQTMYRNVEVLDSTLGQPIKTDKMSTKITKIGLHTYKKNLTKGQLTGTGNSFTILRLGHIWYPLLIIIVIGFSASFFTSSKVTTSL